MRAIPFSKIDVKPEDLQTVAEIINSGWLTHGKYTAYFENLFNQVTNTKHAITLNSCTAALHLSCLALNLDDEAEVIVPAITHAATAHAVCYTGAIPVFADVDPIYGNLTTASIESKINNKTRAVVVVHMAGFPCEMDKISQLCKKYNIALIEDCAHALGTTYQSTHAGNFGQAGCFSFYPTKQITTGEGGMLVTNNDTLAAFAKTHKAFGIDSSPENRKLAGIYDVKTLGYNYRMTDFQAAMGYHQLNRYPANLAIRKQNAKKYQELLKPLENYVTFPAFDSEASYFLFPLLLRDSAKRNPLMQHLKHHQIGASIHYATPLPMMTYYKKRYDGQQNLFLNAIRYADSNISLPVHQSLTSEDIKYISETIKSFFKGK